MQPDKLHEELFYELYPNGYVDFAIGRTYSQMDSRHSSIISGLIWDDELKDYKAVYKIATNRLTK